MGRKWVWPRVLLLHSHQQRAQECLCTHLSLSQQNTTNSTSPSFCSDKGCQWETMYVCVAHSFPWNMHLVSFLVDIVPYYKGEIIKVRISQTIARQWQGLSCQGNFSWIKFLRLVLVNCLSRPSYQKQNSLFQCGNFWWCGSDMRTFVTFPPSWNITPHLSSSGEDELQEWDKPMIGKGSRIQSGIEMEWGIYYTHCIVISF